MHIWGRLFIVHQGVVDKVCNTKSINRVYEKINEGRSTENKKNIGQLSVVNN